MVAVASIKTREASAGRLSHDRMRDCEREGRHDQRGTAAGRCVERAGPECAKALMAIAQTAAVLDSGGRRERQRESENELV